MMTLMTRLCVLCAMSTLLQMILPEDQGRDALRTISGMLMLGLVLGAMQEWKQALAYDRDFASILKSLMT